MPSTHFVEDDVACRLIERDLLEEPASMLSRPPTALRLLPGLHRLMVTRRLQEGIEWGVPVLRNAPHGGVGLRTVLSGPIVAA